MIEYSVKPNIWEKEAKELAIYGPILAHLLFHRGVKSVEDAEKFLKPNYDRDIHSPYLFKDMEKAVKRIVGAIERKEKIAVYSDYDVDGTAGAAIMYELFRMLDYLPNVHFYIPHRDDEGFGFHSHATEELGSRGVKLLITVDCGIVDSEATDSANKFGIDVIITDHHLPQEGRVPKAYTIINPQMPDSGYPFKKLCGAGVAFKLAQAVLMNKDFGISLGQEKWMLDLVGIATLSDMVPLIDENRILAHYGLMVMRKTKRLGLLKLFNLVGIDRKYLVEDDISFTIAPRINAASRMGDAFHAFDLFTANTDGNAKRAADALEGINSERKGLTANISKQAKKMMEAKKINGEEIKLIIMGNPRWKPSIVGPVANNLVDEYSVPVFLWGRSNGILKGSCRAPSGYNILEIMNAVPKGLFIEYGGHAGSGGFSFKEENIIKLEEGLLNAISNSKKVPDSTEMDIDSEIGLENVNLDFYKQIEMLSPFGMNNPKPIFLFRGLTIHGIKDFGKVKNHLEITFKKSNNSIVKAIGFFMIISDWKRGLKVGDKIDLIANMEKSYFRGYAELRLRIIDIK